MFERRVGSLTHRKKAPKGSNKPPTEEERAALRLKKEQEKLAKAQAKLAADNLTPGEVQARSAEAATVVPKIPNGGPSSAAAAVVQTQMPKLKLVAKGKVRDIYELPGEPDKLLFVATDRISAFDVIMQNVSDSALRTLRMRTSSARPRANF
jgi:tyrosyl-tRNA synthetase